MSEPIAVCAECGLRTEPVPAPQDFTNEFWSHCCHAEIEIIAGDDDEGDAA